MSAPGAVARAAVVVAGLALVLVPVRAEAHPFGPPQTVSIELLDDAVRLHWQPGAPDDYSYLAAGIGVTAEDLSQTGGLMAVKRDVDLLRASPLFERYLSDHVAVRDDAGQPCAATVEPAESLVADGVSFEFACPGPAEDPEVELSLLTDLHPAYQTMATGPAGQRFVYSADATAHRWSARAEAEAPALGRSAAVQLTGVLGGLAVAAAATTLVVRRLRLRRRTSS